MWLEVSSGAAPARSLQLGDGELTLGRADDCDLVVDDSFVSNHHARIDVRDGAALITDLASRNGTYVDGELLVTARQLHAGSEIRIGSTLLRVRAPEPVAAVAASRQHVKKRQPGFGQRSVLYLEPSHAAGAVVGAIFTVLFGVLALTALAYRTDVWPENWRLKPDVPDNVALIAAAALGAFALLAVLSAIWSGRRWYIERAVKHVSDDPLLASMHPDLQAAAPLPRAARIPPLDVRFVAPRKLPRLKRRLSVTATRNIAGSPPLEIAYLRLFDNRPRTRTFIEGAWREFGSVWLLRSAASVTTGEYRAAVHGGGLSRMFISSQEQLHAELDRDDRPRARGRQVFRDIGTTKIRVYDRYGSYPVHAMLCHGSFWKEAVDALLAKVDLVALDLSGFGPSNLGTGYELQRVIDRFPMTHVVLLADERSNQKFLDEQIRDAWSNMAAGSPNATDGARDALVVITDHFTKTTTTNQDGSTASETVHLVAQRSESRRVLLMVQQRLEQSRVTAEYR
jgi:hypothetical protein